MPRRTTLDSRQGVDMDLLRNGPSKTSYKDWKQDEMHLVEKVEEEQEAQSAISMGL
jgi:hypothetical protein